MNPPPTQFRIHGRDLPPEPPRPLQAGPLTLHYDHGDLRWVKRGDREILRRIGGAVRDDNWITVPGILSDECIEVSSSSFRIRYTCTHRQGDVHFVWHATVIGDADGTLRFEFDGEAKSTFLRNRIGLFVLHPIPECAGARVRATRVDGTIRERVFPERVAAEQPLEGLDSLAGLSHEIEPGLWVGVRFTGEVFETEDQRNWIDASFKTYGTPLGLPFPVEVTAGTRVRQGLEVRLLDDRDGLHEEALDLRGIGKAVHLTSAATVNVTVPVDGWVRLPELGLGSASHGRPLTESEVDRLSMLNIGHLRAEVRFAEPDWLPRLLGAARSAAALGLPLELAVPVPAEGPDRALSELRRELTRLRADVSRVLVFQEGQKSTTAAALSAVREHLGDLEVPVGAGTDADLYQLQLQRPSMEADFISWSMNPQVHASDTPSLMETPEAAAAQVASVAASCPGMARVVSPITLRPRFNPVATGPEALDQPGELPSSVDPRQMSLVAAAWTVAMLARLAPSGVESLTFFETTGWRGVMETGLGSPLPEKFPSFAGGVFPVWHIFAALNGFRSVAVVHVDDPHRVAALAVANRAGRRRVLLANLTASLVEVGLGQPGAAVRLLDESNVADALREPEAWWRRPATPVGERIALTAFAVAFVDLAS